MPYVRGLSCWVVVASVVVALSAQATKPAFEVASVRPQMEPYSSASMRTAGPRVHPGGVFNSSHVTVESLLAFAHDLMPYAIIGGPDWMRQEMFQIDARAGRDASRDEVKLMVGSLLEDRFKLIARREQREMGVEALVLAHPDGRLGPSLRRVDDCVAARREMATQSPTLTVEASSMSACSAGLSGLARTLSLDLYLGKPVIDATGLKGSFYYTVYSRNVMLEPSAAAANDPKYPSLTVALNEQLGVKLESRRVPFEVLVIDSVQRPTEN